MFHDFVRRVIAADRREPLACEKVEFVSRCVSVFSKLKKKNTLLNRSQRAEFDERPVRRLAYDSRERERESTSSLVPSCLVFEIR